MTNEEETSGGKLVLIGGVVLFAAVIIMISVFTMILGDWFVTLDGTTQFIIQTVAICILLAGCLTIGIGGWRSSQQAKLHEVHSKQEPETG